MKKTVRIIAMLSAVLLCGTLTLASCEEFSFGEAASETEEVTVPKYDGEKIKYDPSATGEGKDISMSAVEKEIGSMNVSDFVAHNGESDYVLIKVKGYGDIVVLLREDVAPASVANFKKLVRSGFYSGTIFHRVMENFMIQGGGIVVKNGAWVQKEADSINGEFAINGFENNLLHLRGVLSMARAKNPNSASSQFFIMHSDYPYLDGQYASFGYVLAGMDVVDAIATCEVEGDSNAPSPVKTVEIESVTFVKPK